MAAPGDLPAAVAGLAPHAATLRLFRDRAGARRACALVDRGDGRRAALVDAPAGEPVTLVVDDRETLVPELALTADPHPDTPELHAVPALAVRRTEEGVDVPLVQLAYLAGHVRTLAGLFAGRSVVTAEWETRDPDLPLTVAARRDEPLVVAVAGEPFPLPPGWPETAG